MPDITIIKLKIRRGTDSQRRSIVLEQSELGYTTDYQRVFVGDGITPGGISIGATVHAPTITTNARLGLTNAIKGDIVSDNSLLYQLTGSNAALSSSWAFIGPKTDDSTLTYSGNSLIIKDGGITGSKFAASAASSTGGLVAGIGGLSANVDNSTLKITATNQLSVNQIDQRHIASTTFSQGIIGGSGTQISVNADTSYFGFNSNVLTLSALPNNTVSGVTLSAESFQYTGSGLTINGNKLQTVLTDVDTITINKNISTGVIGLQPITTGLEAKFSNVTYNNYGQITSKSPTIIDTVSGSNGSSPLSVFNGRYNQVTFTNQTLIPVISSNNVGTTVTVQLTSAGYIFLDTDTYGKIAIPIARYTAYA